MSNAVAFQQPDNPRPARDDAKLPLPIIGRDERHKPTRRSKPVRRLLLPTLLLAVAALGVFAMQAGIFGQDEPKTPPPLDSTPRVFALARLEPEGEVISVAAPSSAGESRIEDLRVDVGDSVRRGDVLAVLDSERRLKAARDAQLRSVQQARMKIAQTQLEVQTTRARLEAALASADATLEVTEDRLKRRRRLLPTSATSREEFESTRLEVQAAQAAVREARARLERYQTTDSQAELVDVSVARQQLAIAESSLEQAEASLAQAYINAPANGTILEINLRPGERVGQNSLLQMGAIRNMMARVEVYESDVPHIHLGQTVKLTASPLSKPLVGTVERIANIVKKQQIVDADPAANTDARIVEVWVRLQPKSSDRASKFVNLQVRAEFQQ